jgi:DNA (cytosine-5)-methyltransferase 1
MMALRLLDLFCGAGGASMGYHRAGFKVVGVDKKHQPNYPFKFHQADALEFPLDGFDVIHASPPCEAYSRITGRHRANHEALIPATRERLISNGAPFIIENVEGAPLKNYFVLCGSMFGLEVRRHRLFECSHLILTPQCNHGAQTGEYFPLCYKNRKAGKKSSVVGVYGHINYGGEFEIRCKAMGIDWMTNAELVKAIPPAYTEFIGYTIKNSVFKLGDI